MKTNPNMGRRGLNRDLRLLFSVATALLFVLMVPSEPGCTLNYLATPWGRMLLLFLASALLWVRNPITQLLSLALSALTFSITVEFVYHGWDQFVLVTTYLINESGASGAARYLWAEFVLILFSLLLFCYGTSLLAQTFIRRHPRFIGTR